MNKSALCLAVMTAFVASGARAVEAAEPAAEKKVFTKPAAPGQEKQADKLASEFGVTKDEVNGLRQKGFGWGEVHHVLMLSRETGKPAADIVKMHHDGMSWGRIAEKEGVKLDGMGKPEKRAADGGEQKATGYERGMSDSDRKEVEKERSIERDRGTRGSDRGTMQREPRPTK